MEYIRLTDSSHHLFEEAWQLYEQSFPLEERRPLSWQQTIMPHGNYRFELVLLEGNLVGILLWWSFEEIRFIEHFATVPALRGQGYGKLILKDFASREERPVLLEVEPPHTEIQRRRIRFYEQNAFILNHHPYQQPPYHHGQPPLKLLLMSHPTSISHDAVSRFVSMRHPTIYEPGNII
ncbi:GNAT family N-acetyltransferase [Pontibacter ramchanderi]|uniref:Acetyltransferase (GNAT) family protein n=1 Tax=Pontibacter ramchanderi TaxID=1179743 RepID=A0A2N3UCZ9_9BACT|nr:GNAT family N-acetyltransferase [Pontibacter ramchanderi]PKV67244.1 acetyltransferase (GNAT) family protein [Pontibacter ramchanderi]